MGDKKKKKIITDLPSRLRVYYKEIHKSIDIIPHNILSAQKKNRETVAFVYIVNVYIHGAVYLRYVQQLFIVLQRIFYTKIADRDRPRSTAFAKGGGAPVEDRKETRAHILCERCDIVIVHLYKERHWQMIFLPQSNYKSPAIVFNKIPRPAGPSFPPVRPLARSFPPRRARLSLDVHYVLLL